MTGIEDKIRSSGLKDTRIGLRNYGI